MKGPIVVCGVTGTVGSRVAAKLAERGVAVRGVCRHPGKFERGEGVELIEADLRRADEANLAVDGAAAVYLTPPEPGAHPLDSERKVAENVIVAARKANVEHLVIHTVLNAKQGGTGARLIDNKRHIERLLKNSGLPFTILRPGWFFQNLYGERADLEQGVLRLPLPRDRRFGSVSAEDVAEVAVRFLEKGPQNRGFDLHVEGGLDGNAICAAASDVVGRPVRYEESGLEEFLRRQSLDDPQRELFKELFLHMRERTFLGKSKEVSKVLKGFEYTQPAEFLRNEMLVRTGGTVDARPAPGGQAAMDPVVGGQRLPEAPGPTPHPPEPPGRDPPGPHFD